jgi:hypothetical protein
MVSAGILERNPAEGKEHLAALQQMASSDPDPAVRQAASKAVQAIEKAAK